MPTAFFTHPDCVLHDMGSGHPEQPARLAAITDQLHRSGLYPLLLTRQARPATSVQILRAHDAAHVAKLSQWVPTAGERIRLDPDTSINEHSWHAALRAAGAGVQAVDGVMAGEFNSAFCAVRPPGHHAERDRAMGFCLLNNIAVAALHGLQTHGLERVAIIDFDVHYGNGTADIVSEDERVLLCSLFQYPLYPLQAPPPPRDHFKDLPMQAGEGSDAFRHGVVEHWLPALRKHAPEFVFFSAGFDAHADDPLAGLRLIEDDFAWVTERVLDETRESAGGRCVSMLEGGYDLAALGRSAAAHIRTLMAFS